MPNDNSRIDHKDPNVQVCIAALKIGMETQSGDIDWSRAATNIHAVNGINTDEGTYKLLYGVLEATACLSVSEDRLQVVAVALHIGERWGGKPMLTIAENCDLRPGLGDHIEWLWGRLRAMSKIRNEGSLFRIKTEIIESVYRYSVSKNLRRYNKWIPRLELFAGALRVTGSGDDTFWNHVESLKLTHQELRKILVSVKSPAAETGWNELVTRVREMKDDPKKVAKECEKWVSTLSWMKALPIIDNVDETPDKDLKMVTDTLSGEEFEKVVQSFKSTRESFRNILATMKPLAEINWENLIGRMDKVMGESDNVIGNCKVWAADKRLWAAARPKDIEIVESEFADFKKWVSDLEKAADTFPAARALGKLTTQDRYVGRLVAASTDVTLRPLFVSPMNVRGVPATKNVPITLPSTEGEWQSIIRAMYESIKPRITKNLIDLQVTVLSGLLVSHGKFNPYQGVIHCECALVAYLEQPDNKLPGQFNYIGVSKLSCGACHSWLMAYNSTCRDELKYYTAGTHGKWYYPWAIPPSLATTELKDELSKIVCGQFVRYCDPGMRDKKAEDLSGSTHAKSRPWVSPAASQPMG